MGFLRTLFCLIPALSVILPSSCLAIAWETTISPGSGPWKLTVSHLGLVDSSRPDPYLTHAFSNSTNARVDRKIMVTLFCPVDRICDRGDDKCHETCTKTCKVPYMTAATAAAANKMFLGDEKADVFNKVEYNTCCATSGTLYPGNMNIVILEPAVGTSRLLYGAIAQEIASHGSNVFLLDHPGDANIVEFAAPPGSGAVDETILQSQTINLNPFSAVDVWNKTGTNAIKTREADINFLLSSLSNNMTLATALLPGFKVGSAFNPSKGVGITGHGVLGGAVATDLGLQHSEIFKYAVNLAGTPPIVSHNDTTSNLVFFGRNPGFKRDDDFAWRASWKHLHGRITEWDLQNSEIFDFTDVPKIVEMAGVGKGEGKVKGLGEVERLRAFGATAQFVRSYMTMVDRPVEGGNALSGLVRFFTPDMLPYAAYVAPA